MKKITIASMMGTLFIATTACSHFKWDDTGDYGNFWMLEQLDSMSTGEQIDYRGRQIFWAIQGEILEITDKSNGLYRSAGLLFEYTEMKDSLFLRHPRYSRRMEGDPDVTDVEVIKPYGVNQLENHFKVEKINGSHMVLRDDVVRLHFKSF